MYSVFCVYLFLRSKKLAALAEHVQKAELSKAKLGFELEELEAAAVLVQEEAKELKAAGAAVSRQPLPPPSEGEESDSDDSSSTSSYETGGSDSEEQESSASEDGKINPLQSTLQEERTAPLIDCNGLRRDADTLTWDVSNEKSKSALPSTSVPGELIEELGKQMQTAIRLTEQPVGSSPASDSSSSLASVETATSPAGRPRGLSLDQTGKGPFLEVTPTPSPFLFLGTTNEAS